VSPHLAINSECWCLHN